MSDLDGKSDRQRQRERLDRQKRGDPKRFEHGVIDMTGKFVAGAVVLARAANIAGNAAFHVKLVCDHRQIELGTKLRHSERTSCVVKCVTCGKKSRP